MWQRLARLGRTLEVYRRYTAKSAAEMVRLLLMGSRWAAVCNVAVVDVDVSLQVCADCEARRGVCKGRDTIKRNY